MTTRTLRRYLTILAVGWSVASCTVVTDPTKASSDFSSSSSGGSSKKDGALQENKKLSDFATVNFARLKKDIAAGKGEHLSAFAVLLHVPPEQQPAFFAFTQEKFPVLCPSEKVTATEMIAALSRELATHPRFHLFVDQPS